MKDQSLKAVSERFKRTKSREFVAYCFFCVLFTVTTLIQARPHCRSSASC
jgi:hypothetical protein